MSADSVRLIVNADGANPDDWPAFYNEVTITELCRIADVFDAAMAEAGCPVDYGDSDACYPREMVDRAMRLALASVGLSGDLWR
jgi:hypothetical protein